MSPEAHPKSFHISIVGNVGTGKSTLARLIQRRIHCHLYLEDPEDYLFVRLFFDAPHDWSFANLLHFIMVKTAQQAQIHQQNQLAVQEMNAHAIRCIWTPALHEIGYISQTEMTAIEQVYDLLAATPISMPDMSVVLQTSLATQLDRIRKRGRDFEELAPEFIRLLEILDHNFPQFTERATGNVMMIDAEAVDFTRPSRTREDLLDVILRQMPRPFDRGNVARGISN